VDTIIRAIAIYVILLVLFRIVGTRTLSQVTTFDLILLLFISEAIQQALIDNDNSMTNAVLLVVTLLGMNVVLSLAKQRSRKFEQLVDGTPVVLLENGTLHVARMAMDRVDEADILEAARCAHGIERLDQLKYVVLEKCGEISVVPREQKSR
jgi:uncharacterized membrane protein YcaP (DUF421 family)